MSIHVLSGNNSLSWRNTTLHHALFDGFIADGSSPEETAKSIKEIFEIPGFNQIMSINQNDYVIITINEISFDAICKYLDTRTVIICTGVTGHAVGLAIRKESNSYIIKYVNTGLGCEYNGAIENGKCQGLLKFLLLSKESLIGFLDLIKQFENHNLIKSNIEYFYLCVMNYLIYDSSFSNKYFHQSIDNNDIRKNRKIDHISVEILSQKLDETNIEQIKYQLSGVCSFRSIFYLLLDQFTMDFDTMENQVKWFLLNFLLKDVVTSAVFYKDIYQLNTVLEAAYILYDTLDDQFDILKLKSDVYANLLLCRNKINDFYQGFDQKNLVSQTEIAHNTHHQMIVEIKDNNKTTNFSINLFTSTVSFKDVLPVSDLVNILKRFYKYLDQFEYNSYIFKNFAEGFDAQLFLVRFFKYIWKTKDAQEQIKNNTCFNIWLIFVFYKYFKIQAIRPSDMENSIYSHYIVGKLCLHNYLKIIFGKGEKTDTIVEHFILNGEILAYCIDQENLYLIDNNEIMNCLRQIKTDELVHFYNNVIENNWNSSSSEDQIENFCKSSNLQLSHLGLLFCMYYNSDRNIRSISTGPQYSNPGISKDRPDNLIILTDIGNITHTVTTDISNLTFQKTQYNTAEYYSSAPEFDNFEKFFSNELYHQVNISAFNNFSNLNILIFLNQLYTLSIDSTSSMDKLVNLLNDNTINHDSIFSYIFTETEYLCRTFRDLPCKNAFLNLKSIYPFNTLDHYLQILHLANKIIDEVEFDKIITLIFCSCAIYNFTRDSNEIIYEIKNQRKKNITQSLLDMISHRLDSYVIKENDYFNKNFSSKRTSKSFKSYLIGCIVYLILYSEINQYSDSKTNIYFNSIYEYLSSSTENIFEYSTNTDPSIKQLAAVFVFFISNKYFTIYPIIQGNYFFNHSTSTYKFELTNSMTSEISVKYLKNNLTKVDTGDKSYDIDYPSLNKIYNRIYMKSYNIYQDEKVFPYPIFWSEYICENYLFSEKENQIVLNEDIQDNAHINHTFPKKILVESIKDNPKRKIIKCKIIFEDIIYTLTHSTNSTYLDDLLHESLTDHTIWFDGIASYLVFVFEDKSFIRYNASNFEASINDEYQIIIPHVNGTADEKMSLSWVLHIRSCLLTKKNNQYYIVLFSYKDPKNTQSSFGVYPTDKTSKIQQYIVANKTYYISIAYNFLTIDLTDNEAFLMYFYHWSCYSSYRNTCFLLRSFQASLRIMRLSEESELTHSILHNMKNRKVNNIYSTFIIKATIADDILIDEILNIMPNYLYSSTNINFAKYQGFYKFDKILTTNMNFVEKLSSKEFFELCMCVYDGLSYTRPEASKDRILFYYQNKQSNIEFNKISGGSLTNEEGLKKYLKEELKEKFNEIHSDKPLCDIEMYYDNYKEFSKYMYEDIHNANKLYKEDHMKTTTDAKYNTLKEYYELYLKCADLFRYLTERQSINDFTLTITKFIEVYGSSKTKMIPFENGALTEKYGVYIRLYEFLNGFFLKCEQLKAINIVIYDIINKNTTDFFQFIMAGGKTSVIIPLVSLLLTIVPLNQFDELDENYKVKTSTGKNFNQRVIIVQPDHLIKQTCDILKRGIALMIPYKLILRYDPIINKQLGDIFVINDSGIKILKLKNLIDSNSALIFDEVDDMANNMKSELNIIAKEENSKCIHERFLHLLNKLMPETQQDQMDEKYYNKLILKVSANLIELSKTDHLLDKLNQLEQDVEKVRNFLVTSERMFKKYLSRNNKILGGVSEAISEEISEAISEGISEEILGGTSCDNNHRILFIKNIDENILTILHDSKHLLNYGLRNTMKIKNATIQESLYAIPYLGKDIPSLDSEFTDVDIRIAYTILSYNELKSLRDSDMNRLLDFYYKAYAQSIMNNDGRDLQIKHQYEYVIMNKKKRSWRLPHIRRCLKWSTIKELYGVNNKSVYSRLVLKLYLTNLVLSIQDKVEIFNISFIDILSNDTSIYKIGLTGTPYILMPFDLGKKFNKIKIQAGANGFILRSLLLTHDDLQIVRKNVLLTDIIELCKGYQTLIDCAALLLNYENAKVAEAIYEKILKPIVYFTSSHQMMIFENGAHDVFKASGSTSSYDYFVFFDQGHITGVDIKMIPNALGLLTIDSKSRLRDVSQAAFRMRNIGLGQEITYVATELGTHIQSSVNTYKRNYKIVEMFNTNEALYMEQLKRDFLLQSVRTLVRNYKKKRTTETEYDDRYFLNKSGDKPNAKDQINQEINAYERLIKNDKTDQIDAQLHEYIEELKKYDLGKVNANATNISKVTEVSANVSMEIESNINISQNTNQNIIKNTKHNIKVFNYYLFDIPMPTKKLNILNDVSTDNIIDIFNNEYSNRNTSNQFVLLGNLNIVCSTYILFMLFCIFNIRSSFKNMIIIWLDNNGIIYLMTSLEFYLVVKSGTKIKEWKPIYALEKLEIEPIKKSFIKLFLNIDPSMNDVELVSSDAACKKYLTDSLHDTYFYQNTYAYPYGLLKFDKENFTSFRLLIDKYNRGDQLTKDEQKEVLRVINLPY